MELTGLGSANNDVQGASGEGEFLSEYKNISNKLKK